MEHLLSNIFICFPVYLLFKINDKRSFLLFCIYFALSLVINSLTYEDKNTRHCLNDSNFIILCFELSFYRKISSSFLLNLLFNIFYYIFYLEFKNYDDYIAMKFLWNTATYYNLFIVLNCKRRYRNFDVTMG